MGKLIFMWALASPIIYLIRDAGSPQTCLTVMTSMNPSTLNSYHFQTCSLGMAMEAEVVVSPGASYIDCGSGPSEAGRATADGL